MIFVPNTGCASEPKYGLVVAGGTLQTKADSKPAQNSQNFSKHWRGGNLEETICPEESQCFFTGWVNSFPNTEFEKLNPSNSS